MQSYYYPSPVVQLGTWDELNLSWYLTNIAVRLDLTAASRAYIMEPQWNPMAEEQALDRIHRLGQTRPVTTIRYIMKDTWEEVSVLDERIISCSADGVRMWPNCKTKRDTWPSSCFRRRPSNLEMAASLSLG